MSSLVVLETERRLWSNQLLQFCPPLCKMVFLFNAVSHVRGAAEALVLVADVAEEHVDRFEPLDHVRLVLSAESQEHKASHVCSCSIEQERHENFYRPLESFLADSLDKISVCA